MFLRLNEAASNFAGGPLRFELFLCDEQMGQVGSFDQQKTPLVMPREIHDRVRAFTEEVILPEIANQTGMAVELSEVPK